MKLIIYMPAYNEEENIQKAIDGLPVALSGIDTIEKLVIDDGSADKTAELARTANALVISHEKNRGVGAAFHSAVQFALENDADILVGIDADGQFDPLEIPGLIAPILSNRADMVIGNRFIQGIPENMPPLKYWGNNRISKLISTICHQDFQDVSCGYRAYNREALLRLNLFAEFTYTHETILSLIYQGLRVMDHPIRVKYYPERKSRVANSIVNYAMQTSKIILRVVLDYRPLRVFGTLGVVLMLIGVVFELFLFGYYAITQSFSPYKSAGFIGLGFIIFGMLVLLIALIADMLNRLRINQDKILYQIKKSRYEK
jgi:glycosyltransferase involved in cell wall biosynthesis